MVFCSFSTFEITLRLLEHAYICARHDRSQHRCELVPRTRALNFGSTFLPYIEITKNFLGDTASGKHKFLLKVGQITFREQSKPPPYLFCFPRRWVLASRKSDARARVENWYEPPECSSYCAELWTFRPKGVQFLS